MIGKIRNEEERMQIANLVGAIRRFDAGSQRSTDTADDPLMTQAKALEASFLSEMLGYAGVGAASEDFGGGIGEEQFSSFLRDEEARQMVAHGGIGLAETLFNAMRKG
jgi:peptidoglycan hydrolase FlgJ